MDPLTVGVITGLVALAAGFAAARVQDRLRMTSTQTRVNELLAKAQADAESFRKEAELKAKDELFNKREELNREFDQKLNEVRDQERRLDKKEDVLEQRHQAQQKKDRELDHSKKKLSERKEALEKRTREVEALAE